jgi:hypothetical protein
MIAIAFSIVSGGACLFLSYAFVRFTQELKHLRCLRPSGKLKVARKGSNYFPPCVVMEESKRETLARRDLLANGILG